MVLCFVGFLIFKIFLNYFFLKEIMLNSNSCTLQYLLLPGKELCFCISAFVLFCSRNTLCQVANLKDCHWHPYERLGLIYKSLYFYITFFKKNYRKYHLQLVTRKWVFFSRAGRSWNLEPSSPVCSGRKKPLGSFESFFMLQKLLKKQSRLPF